MGLLEPDERALVLTARMKELGVESFTIPVELGVLSVTFAKHAEPIDMARVMERLNTPPKPRNEDEAFEQEAKELVP